jgi:hypothetical protein
MGAEATDSASVGEVMVTKSMLRGVSKSSVPLDCTCQRELDKGWAGINLHDQIK